MPRKRNRPSPRTSLSPTTCETPKRRQFPKLKLRRRQPPTVKNSSYTNLKKSSHCQRLSQQRNEKEEGNDNGESQTEDYLQGHTRKVATTDKFKICNEQPSNGAKCAVGRGTSRRDSQSRKNRLSNKVDLSQPQEDYQTVSQDGKMRSEIEDAILSRKDVLCINALKVKLKPKNPHRSKKVKIVSTPLASEEVKPQCVSSIERGLNTMSKSARARASRYKNRKRRCRSLELLKKDKYFWARKKKLRSNMKEDLWEGLPFNLSMPRPYTNGDPKEKSEVHDQREILPDGSINKGTASTNIGPNKGNSAEKGENFTSLIEMIFERESKRESQREPEGLDDKITLEMNTNNSNNTTLKGEIDQPGTSTNLDFNTEKVGVQEVSLAKQEIEPEYSDGNLRKGHVNKPSNKSLIEQSIRVRKSVRNRRSYDNTGPCEKQKTKLNKVEETSHSVGKKDDGLGRCKILSSLLQFPNEVKNSGKKKLKCSSGSQSTKKKQSDINEGLKLDGKSYKITSQISSKESQDAAPDSNLKIVISCPKDPRPSHTEASNPETTDMASWRQISEDQNGKTTTENKKKRFKFVPKIKLLLDNHKKSPADTDVDSESQEKPDTEEFEREKNVYSPRFPGETFCERKSRTSPYKAQPGDSQARAASSSSTKTTSKTLQKKYSSTKSPVRSPYESPPKRRAKSAPLLKKAKEVYWMEQDQRIKCSKQQKRKSIERKDNQVVKVKSEPMDKSGDVVKTEEQPGPRVDQSKEKKDGQQLECPPPDLPETNNHARTRSTEINESLSAGLPGPRMRRRRDIGPSQAELLKDVRLGIHACSLWSSDNRRHYQLKHPELPSSELDTLMRNNWESLTKKEKLFYFKRAQNATQEKPKPKKEQKKEKGPSVDSNAEDKFYEMLPSQQNNILKEKLEYFQSHLSPYQYDQFLQDYLMSFRSSVENVRYRKGRSADTSQPFVKGSDSAHLDKIARKLLYSKIKAVEPYINEVRLHKRVIRYERKEEELERQVWALIQGQSIIQDENCQSAILTELLDAIREVENKSPEDENSSVVYEKSAGDCGGLTGCNCSCQDEVNAVQNIQKELQFIGTTKPVELVIAKEKLLVQDIPTHSRLNSELLRSAGDLKCLPDIKDGLIDYLESMVENTSPLEEDGSLIVHDEAALEPLEEAWHATYRHVNGLEDCCELQSTCCVLNNLLIDKLFSTPQ